MEEQKKRRVRSHDFQVLHDCSTLDWTKAFDLLNAWLQHMLTNKGNSVRRGNYVRNRFEWPGFFLKQDEIHTCCLKAFQAAEEGLGRYRNTVHAAERSSSGGVAEVQTTAFMIRRFSPGS
jgi:hypothetical protein